MEQLKKIVVQRHQDGSIRVVEYPSPLSTVELTAPAGVFFHIWHASECHKTPALEGVVCAFNIDLDYGCGAFTLERGPEGDIGFFHGDDGDWRSCEAAFQKPPEVILIDGYAVHKDSCKSDVPTAWLTALSKHFTDDFVPTVMIVDFTDLTDDEEELYVELVKKIASRTGLINQINKETNDVYYGPICVAVRGNDYE